MPMLDSRIHNEQLTEKFPFAADGKKYEEPQLDIIQRIRPGINAMSPLNPSPQSSENTVGEEVESI